VLYKGEAFKKEVYVLRVFAFKVGDSR